MSFKFECGWCGELACDIEGQVCSYRCEQNEKAFRLAEVEAILNDDKWAVFAEYKLLHSLLTA